MVLVWVDELVKIARNRSHGMVGRCDAEVFKLGNSRRKNRGLYLACGFQFRFDGKQTALVRKHDLQSYVPQRKQKDGKAQRAYESQWAILQHGPQIGVQHLQRKNERTSG